MSFPTTRRLPCVMTYAQAMALHTRVQPIRGTGIQRPLGQRRTKHLWFRHVDKGAGEAGEAGEAGGHLSQARFDFFCYALPQTVQIVDAIAAGRLDPNDKKVQEASNLMWGKPVLSIYEDNTIVIKPSYISAYTCDFIRNLLYRAANLRINGTYRGHMLIEIESTKYRVSEASPLTVRLDNDPNPNTNPFRENLTVVSAAGITDYAPNPKKWAVIKRKYKPFTDYFKSMVSMLCAPAEVSRWGPELFEPKTHVRIPLETFEQVFDMHPRVTTTPTPLEAWKEPWGTLLRKPTWIQPDKPIYNKSQGGQLQRWFNARAAFLDLIEPTGSDEDLGRFYKAALVIFMAAKGATPYNSRLIRGANNTDIVMSKSAALRLTEHTLLLCFAEQVMEPKQYAAGTGPTKRYRSYMFAKPEEANT